MTLNSIVVVSLGSPAERFVGRLLDLNAAGATVRGIDLNAFEDWTTDVRRKEENGVRPTTIFFPLRRVEKIMLDEGTAAIPSLADTFLARAGSPMARELE
jgi:hypothetical protein